METISERIRRVRNECGLSQRELAIRANKFLPNRMLAETKTGKRGVSYAYISRIEAGKRFPSLTVVRTLAKVLDVSPEYLETGVEPIDYEQMALDILEEARAIIAYKDGQIAAKDETISEARKMLKSLRRELNRVKKESSKSKTKTYAVSAK